MWLSVAFETLVCPANMFWELVVLLTEDHKIRQKLWEIRKTSGVFRQCYNEAEAVCAVATEKLI